MPEVADTEPLVRFLLERNSFSVDDERVKYPAFMPSRQGKTSVYRILGLTDGSIWETGTEVSKARDKPLYGRAEIAASIPMALALTIIPSEPPEHHANIEGWSEVKSLRQLRATQLA